MSDRQRVTTEEWNDVYQRVIRLTERRNAYFGIWDGANKVAWACRRLLTEYEGKSNRDEQFVAEVRHMQEAAQAKVSQLDPQIARIDAEIDQHMVFLHNHEGVA